MPQQANYQRAMMPQQYTSTSVYRNSLIRNDVKRVNAEGKREDSKYEFLFNINYNYVLMLSDMNPIRTKSFKELDEQTQGYIRKIDEAVEQSSKKLSELQQTAVDIREKLENSLDKEIKAFIMELKDVSHKIRLLNEFIKSSDEEFGFYRLALKDYEDVLAKLKGNFKTEFVLPSKALASLVVFLENRVQVLRVCIEDLIETVSELDSDDIEFEKNLSLYSELIVESNTSFNRLLEKATEVIDMVNRVSKKTVGYGYRGGRREMVVEGLEEDGVGLVEKRLDGIIRGSYN